MTPKTLYLADDAQKKWHEATFRSAAGLRALHAVFAQYCSELPNAVDGGTAISVNAKRAGAAEFIQHLIGFTIPATAPKSNIFEDALLDTRVQVGPTTPVKTKK